MVLGSFLYQLHFYREISNLKGETDNRFLIFPLPPYFAFVFFYYWSFFLVANSLLNATTSFCLFLIIDTIKQMYFTEYVWSHPPPQLVIDTLEVYWPYLHKHPEFIKYSFFQAKNVY